MVCAAVPEHQLLLLRFVTERDLTHRCPPPHFITFNLATKEDDLKPEILEVHYRGDLKEESID